MLDDFARHLTPSGRRPAGEDPRQAAATLPRALSSFVAGGAPPDAAERAAFRYPELGWIGSRGAGGGAVHPPRLGAPAAPGAYATTVTQPAHFRLLLEQLQPLAGEFGAAISVGPGEQNAYPYALEDGTVR